MPRCSPPFGKKVYPHIRRATAPERKEVSIHDSVFSQLINGLSLGSIYALIALGYSMVYGIILLLNFAHGDVIMVGAYMSWFVMNQLGLGPVTAVCATISPVRCWAWSSKRSPTPPAQRTPYLSAHHSHRRVVLPRVHG